LRMRRLADCLKLFFMMAPARNMGQIRQKRVRIVS
jgi:hypothetical protein